MSLKLKWLENIDSLVAGLHKGRAAARIFVCSQQKPRTEQVEGFSCLFCICLSSHPVNFGVWKEWQFLQHLHGQVRLLVVITTSFSTQEKGETIFSKAKTDNEGLFVQIFNNLNQVTFDDETPERPPPPPPARLQSINTMKDFSGVSQAYNQVGL